MLKKSDIDTFFSNDKIALIGLSRNKDKFGNMIYDELSKRGYQMLPIHHAPKIGDIECYPNVESLPEDMRAIIICTKSDNMSGLIDSAIQRGITNIWIQQGASNQEIKQFVGRDDLTIIDNECILMYIPKNGFPHNFHHWLWRLLGKAEK